MDRALSDDYDADTLKLLGRAFDSAWRDVGGNCLGVAEEGRRMRLALIILELARRGDRNEKSIRAAAVSIMTGQSKNPCTRSPRFH